MSNRYELAIRRKGEDERVVAVGSYDAMHAVRRLYGGTDCYKRLEGRSELLVGAWVVEEQSGWLRFDRAPERAPKPLFSPVLWIYLSVQHDGCSFSEYRSNWKARRLLELPDDVQERETWNAPIREGIERGDLTPLPWAHDDAAGVTRRNLTNRCHMCGLQTTRTKCGARFCGDCDEPVHLRFHYPLALAETEYPEGLRRLS